MFIIFMGVVIFVWACPFLLSEYFAYLNEPRNRSVRMTEAQLYKKNLGRKQEMVNEYHYKPLSSSLI